MNAAVSTIPIDEISPAKINGQIYKPILPDDPATISLMKSMDKHGLLEAVGISTAKKSSSKYQGFVKERGSDAVYELEAVPPEKLKELLRDAISSVLDIDLYNAEIRKEQQEQSEIIALKSKMQSCLCFLKSEVKP